MNKINQKHQSIKFDFKFSKENIQFLEALVYIDSNSKLQTTLCKKPTDCQNYLLAKSARPLSLKKVSRIVRHLEVSAYVQPSRNTKSIHKI